MYHILRYRVMSKNLRCYYISNYLQKQLEFIFQVSCAHVNLKSGWTIIPVHNGPCVIVRVERYVTSYYYYRTHSKRDCLVHLLNWNYCVRSRITLSELIYGYFELHSHPPSCDKSSTAFARIYVYTGISMMYAKESATETDRRLKCNYHRRRGIEKRIKELGQVFINNETNSDNKVWIT